MAKSLNPIPTLDEALNLPFGTLAIQDAGTFAALKQEAAERLDAALKAHDLIDAALVFKYNQHARDERLAAGIDAGVVQFDDNGVRITVDQPKEVEWNQAVLTGIVAHMKAQGVDPAEFVQCHYTVDEAAYAGWSTPLRANFRPARNVVYGMPTFRLTLLAESTAVTP